MIAIYRGQIYRANRNLDNRTIRLITCNSSKIDDTFSVKKSSVFGKLYYKNLDNCDEIEELFTIDFFCYYQIEKNDTPTTFNVLSLKNDLLFITKYDTKRGDPIPDGFILDFYDTYGEPQYHKLVSLDECEGFFVKKSTIDKNNLKAGIQGHEPIKIVSKSEFIQLFNMYSHKNI